MSFLTTVQCRARQALLRSAQRKTGPLDRQQVEEGPGAVFSVAQILRSNRLRKPLVAVGRGGEMWSERVTHALEESDLTYALWDDLERIPTVEEGEKLRRAWLGEGCDCFIALGDGAVLDLVKAAAAGTASRSRTILSLVGQGKLRGRKLPPVITIPVIAGSGAESAAWATVTDERGSRFVMEDRALAPAYVILDPELLADMPREDLARAIAGGVTLAAEAYLSGYGTDITRTLAAEALRDFLQAAEPCWNSGGTMRQRAMLLSASRKAGWAASAAGFGYVRALAHGIERVAGIGVEDACAVILPECLEKYGNPARNALAALASASGAAEEGSREEKAAALIHRLRQMMFRLGLPETLEGIEGGMPAEIGDLAAAEANPRYAAPVVWTAEDCGEILRALSKAE